MITPVINYLELKENWKTIHAFASQARVIPRTAALFKDRYGEFTTTAGVQSFLEALNGIDRILQSAGYPGQLKDTLAAEPDYLTGAGMPKDSYAQSVWLANQTGNIAGSIAGSLQGWETMLGTAVADAAHNAQQISKAINGLGGITAQTNAIGGYAELIGAGLASADADFQKAFIKITGTALLAEANETIGRLETQNGYLQSELEAMQSKKHGFFVNKAKVEKEIADHTAIINANEQELTRKRRLTTDLNTPFFVTGNKVTTALMDIKDTLMKAAVSFKAYSTRLVDMVKVSGEEQLGDYNWVKQAIDLPSQLAGWQKLKNLSEAYSISMFGV